MHGLELKPLAAVHGHQPHGIHMQCRGGNLAQIALFGEQHELADAIERALYRQADSRPGCARARNSGTARPRRFACAVTACGARHLVPDRCDRADRW